MKKYTNKILIVTLIAAAVLMVVVGTVEMRKAFHKGEIKTTKEWKTIHVGSDESDVQLTLDSLETLSNIEK